VDAVDGPMAQTRFVLRKAFENHLKPIVVINKMDRPNARPAQVLDEVVSLFCDLEAPDHVLEFSVVYAAGRAGWAVRALGDDRKDFQPLFKAILEEIPGPTGSPEGDPLLSIASIEYDSYVGRVAVGRLREGTLRRGMTVGVRSRDGSLRKETVEKLFVFEKLGKVEVEEVGAGEICAVVGFEQVEIGETVCNFDNPRFIDVPPVEPPTISVIFSINTSPLSGREGPYVQSRKIRERLFRETESDVALKVEETDSSDSFKVSGRGTLHIGILIERLRREGYEFSVGKPEVIMRGSDEPIEKLIVDVPTEYGSTVISLVTRRRGELMHAEQKGGHVKQEFLIPSRGLIGLRTRMLTATRGEAVMQTLFEKYAPYKGPIAGRSTGVQVSMAEGAAVAFGLFGLKDRGPHFVKPGDPCYEGMIVGEHCRPDDIDVNPCRTKKLTNIRSAGNDENVLLSPPRVFGVEEALEYIEEDELVEVTPKSLRLRKRILQETARRKAARDAAKVGSQAE
jgi:GTP-binding protein